MKIIQSDFKKTANPDLLAKIDLSKDFPSTKDSIWRGSEINQFKDKTFYLNEKTNKSILKTVKNTFVFSNGILKQKPVHSDEINFGALKDFKKKEKLKNILKDIKKEESIFSNIDFFKEKDFFFIHIQKTTDPIKIHYLKEKLKDSEIIKKFLIIFIDKEVQFSMSHLYESINETEVFSKLNALVYLEKKAHLEWVEVYKESQVYNFNKTWIYQSENSSVKHFIFHETGKWLRRHILTKLKEKNSSYELDSVFQLFEKECAEIIPEIYHEGKKSLSDIKAKGILGKDSKISFNGLIRIEEKASMSATAVMNKNMIFDQSAEVCTQPNLEVMTDEVEKATHGCTTGEISEKEKFYLLSRGIGEKDIFNLLKESSKKSLLGKIENKKTQKTVQGWI